MSKKSTPIPGTLASEIHKFFQIHNCSTKGFARQCGLSATVIAGILNGNHKMYSKYSQKRINVVLHNGVDLSNEPRRVKAHSPKGKTVPIPTWFIGSIRDFMEAQPNPTVAGRKIGIDGGVLVRVVAGTQTMMRQSSVDKIRVFFGPPISLPAKHIGDPKPEVPIMRPAPVIKRQHADPLGCAAKEMNLIHDAFNSWSPEQREAFSNFTHTFRNRKEPVETVISNWNAKVTALESEVNRLSEASNKLRKRLSSAEASATKWEHEYLKLKEKLETILS